MLLTGCGDDGDSETDASAADDASEPTEDEASEPADDDASEPTDDEASEPADDEDDEAAAAGGEFCESFELDAVSEATGTDMEVDELSTFEDSCAFESTDHAVRSRSPSC